MVTYTQKAQIKKFKRELIIYNFQDFVSIFGFLICVFISL